MYWAEHTDSTYHGVPPKLLPAGEFAQRDLVGFTTVYEFPQVTKDWIDNNEVVDKWGKVIRGSFVGLAASEMPVSTDKLIADFDNDKDSAMKFLSFLKSIGVGWWAFDSGGSEKTGWLSERWHIVVDCERMEDASVPFSQMMWMEEWAASCGASFDRTIYRAASLIRLPGTIHARTGHPKQLVDWASGYKLSYDISNKPERKTPENFEEARQSFWRQMLREQPEGGRRFMLWKLVSAAQSLGYDDKLIVDHILWWNSRLSTPLTDKELKEKLWQSGVRVL